MTVRMVLTAGMLLVSGIVMAQEQEPQQGDQGNQQQQEKGVVVHGNVYGGGNLGDVGTHVDQSPNPSVGNYDWKDKNGAKITSETAAENIIGISKVTITSEKAEVWGNVFGGGKGEAKTFECEKGMVYQTKVEITKGTVGTLVGDEGSQTLKEGTGNVYGGGEVGRVEGNTVVEIGATGTVPVIRGSVFGAGAGIETHGYSALVRGTSTVTVQGGAQVRENVYGGGEMASVGKYKIKVKNDPLTPSDAPSSLPVGMPYLLERGGTCKVTIQGSAVIGTENVASTGHVFGAGKGLNPKMDYDYVTEENYTGEGSYQEDGHKPKRMVSGNTWDYFASKDAYLQFVETFALSGEADLTISGSANVWGSVYGGSESGIVFKNTIVEISGGTVHGDAFGGGLGLDYFAEAGRVSGNTNLTISGDAAVKGNVYGGGSLGDVGTIKKDLTYNYKWIKSGSHGNVNAEGNDNTAENNKVTYAENETNRNTGVCTVEISGGTIGNGTSGGNVFGAGRGYKDTWWCEKAIVYATNVNISGSISGSPVVNGTVYGGGEIGRVEDDSKVVIGTEGGSDAPDIKGNVFGSGAGISTRGYSALVRGNSMVTVQGASKIGGSVFGGGEMASLGKFQVIGGLPKYPLTGGNSTVTIRDNATIGTDGHKETGYVYGAGQGATPAFDSSNYKNNKSMQLYANRPIDPDTKIEKKEGEYWDYFKNEAGEEDKRFVWVYYHTKEEYQAFLNTLAIASHPVVTIAGSATVYGDVYGGGQRGITLGTVEVNINGGTVKQDVYGGGSLADTNKGNWDNDRYVEATVTAGASVAGLYTITGTDTNSNPIYTATAANATADGSTTYYRKGTWSEGRSAATYTTNVTLTSGEIDRNVYGGGLGQLAKDGDSAIEAKVYGDVLVKLNEPEETTQTTGEETTTITTYGDCEVKGTIFGCNNLNGSPQNDVTVHIYKTVVKNSQGKEQDKPDKNTNTYELEAVYGGGNQAAYYPDDVDSRATAKANVIIDGCDLTSIETVYGGGNAASAPATHVLVNSCYEIGTVFGGGNGKDALADGTENPGADVGYKPNTTGTEKISYGTGEALAELRGGTIHKAFGGSNTKGNVRTSATVDLNEPDPNDCPLHVDEVYGAGNEADQDGTSNINLGCISYLSEIYGGAKDADVNSDVVLTIQSGRFDRVFGGNNVGGCIRGSITVNIEETGCHPIIIGQLFGGGNQAGYSVKGYKEVAEKWVPREATDDLEAGMAKAYSDPVVNVKSFTSIGEVYGGGYGASAYIVGNPHVNIDEYVGRRADEDVTANTGKWIHYVVGKNQDNTDKIATIWQPARAAGAIGTIGNVFGGGNEADVKGDTYVNIGTASYVTETVAAGTNVDGYYTRSGEGTTASPYVYTEIVSDTPAALGETYYKKVIGVNITGNVYGGGNAANVTGDTNVVIGKETTTTP